ncbi:hypothetical protein VKT23_011732 [Stygiomarasmius scandens]|uniref:Enamelin n=1 Tax=Marasmiellus scandens TaxID=2682957 RepID=A0ABR1JAJ0_9AGAR
MPGSEFFGGAHDFVMNGTTISHVQGDQYNVENNNNQRITGSYNTYNNHNINSNNHNSNINNADSNNNNYSNGLGNRQGDGYYHTPFMPIPNYDGWNAYAPGGVGSNPNQRWQEEPRAHDRRENAWQGSHHGGQYRSPEPARHEQYESMPRPEYNQQVDPRDRRRQAPPPPPPPPPPRTSNRPLHPREEQGRNQRMVPAPFPAAGSNLGYVDQRRGETSYGSPARGQQRPHPPQYPSEPNYNYQRQPPPMPTASAPPVAPYYNDSPHLSQQDPNQQDSSFDQEYSESVEPNDNQPGGSAGSSSSMNRDRSSRSASYCQGLSSRSAEQGYR